MSMSVIHLIRVMAEAAYCLQTMCATHEKVYPQILYFYTEETKTNN